MFEARKPGSQEAGNLSCIGISFWFPWLSIDCHGFQYISIAEHRETIEFYLLHVFQSETIKNLYNFCIGTATSSIVGTTCTATADTICRTAQGVRLVSGVQAATRIASVITFAPCCDDVFLT